MPVTMSLAELADRALITDTLHAYCDFVDTHQVDRLVDLFTEDALIDMGHGVRFLSYVYAYHEHAEEDRGMHLWGRYLDELTKESAIWRIRERSLRVAGISYTPFEPVPARFERFDRAPLPER